MQRISARFLGPPSVLALDIGSRYLKAMQLELSGRLPVLRKAPVEAAPCGAVENGIVVDKQAVARALRNMLKRSRINGSRVLLAVGGPNLVLRWIEMPTMSEADLQEAIKFEARKHLPFPVEQAVIDFQVLSRRPRQPEERMRILLIGAPQSLADSKFDTAELAGLDPIGMDIEPLAATRAVTQATPRSELSWGAQPQAVLVLGSTGTDFYVTKDEDLEFSRRIPIGGSNLAEIAASSLGMDPRESDEYELLRTISFDDDGALQMQDAPSDLVEALRAEMSRLDQEIRRSCSYYQSLFPEGSYEGVLSKVLVCGGLASLPGLDVHLARELDAPVEIADPLSRLPLSNVGENLDAANGRRASFIVSAGLLAAHIEG